MSIIKILIATVLVGVCFKVAVLTCFATIKRIRKNRRDRRIIRQAKAVGVWEKPRCLGGRALELKAWEEFRIKRKPGETDRELRRRCMNAADNEYAATKW